MKNNDAIDYNHIEIKTFALFQISMSSLVARLLPQARLLQKTPVGISSVIQKNDIHTSSSSLGSLQMPDRLQHIPDAEVGINTV